MTHAHAIQWVCYIELQYVLFDRIHTHISLQDVRIGVIVHAIQVIHMYWSYKVLKALFSRDVTAKCYYTLVLGVQKLHGTLKIEDMFTNALFGEGWVFLMPCT